MLHIGGSPLARHGQVRVIRDAGGDGQEPLVDLGPDVFVKGQQMVLSVRAENLDGDGLEKVTPLVDLFHVVVGELVDLAFRAEPRHLTGNHGNDGLVSGRRTR